MGEPLDTAPNPVESTGKSCQPLRMREQVLTEFFQTHHEEVDLFAFQECTVTMQDLVMRELGQRGFQALDVADTNQERILYRTSRLKVIDRSERALVSSTMGYGNCVTQCTFLLDGQLQFVLANTHLTWAGCNWDSEKGPINPRFAEMVDICSKLPKQGPLFVVGDLNDSYTPLRVAREHLNLFPCFVSLGVPSPSTYPTPKSVPVCWDDNCFGKKAYDWILQRDVDVMSARRLDFSLDGTYPSDHYPVLATFELQEKSFIW